MLHDQLSKKPRPPDKSVYQKIMFLISQSKHMLWVLKRTVLLGLKTVLVETVLLSS